MLQEKCNLTQHINPHMTNANGAIVEDKIIHPFMWMKTKPGDGMKSLKCTITSVPTDVVTTVLLN